MTSYHNQAHRNRTSSKTAASDEINSTHKNESFKDSKMRQKKPQNWDQLKKSLNTMIASVNDQPIDIDEKEKASSMKKPCTNYAAFKTVLNKTNILNSAFQNLNTSLLKSKPVCSSLSSASSRTSIGSSISSSVSNSPINSANSSPKAFPFTGRRNSEYFRKSWHCSTRSTTSPLKQFKYLNMDEQQLIQQMRRYVIDPSLLRIYGFPVDSIQHEGYVEIYKCLPKHSAEVAITEGNHRHLRHFYSRKTSSAINFHDEMRSSSFTDSDSSEMGEDDLITPIMAFYTPDGVYQIFSEYSNSEEKKCVRCSKLFKVNEDGEYLSFDSCTYHWGKLSLVNNNGKGFLNIYSCCQKVELSEGCTKHPLHVWNGTVFGINGPYSDFVHTAYKERKRHKNPKMYAIDCEMSYTGLGLELTKVTVVGYDGSLVYEHFVHPLDEIVDYNTRFSGVSEKDFSPESNNIIKTFAEVQTDLLNLFDADTILIGHGLENDLRVLRLVHKTIVDTSIIFKHSTGYPYKRSLKSLTKSYLKRDIQNDEAGHSGFEDSRACLELMMWKIRKDLHLWNYQY